MEKPHVIALQDAITLAGNQAELANRLREAAKDLRASDCESVSQQTISYWLTNEVLIDPKWWPLFERATSKQITRRKLRPDVFNQLAVG